jgi:acyl-CoA synthetase (AMP-forming)/AMP-acid ligase II
MFQVCGKIGGPQLEQLRADNVLPLRPQNLKGFSWLPQYHDMGLIYCMVAPFAMGCSMVSIFLGVRN